MSGELAAIAARWELSARERIRHTIAAYTIAGDSLRHEELAAQFTEDGVLEVDGRETAQGRDAIAAMLARHAGAGAPDGPGESFFIRHFVANVLIADLTPTSAPGARLLRRLHTGRPRSLGALSRRVRLDRRSLVAAPPHRPGGQFGARIVVPPSVRPEVRVTPAAA